MRETEQSSDTNAVQLERSSVGELNVQTAGRNAVPRLRLYWNHRRFLMRWTFAGLVISTLIAFLIPKRYESTVQLMPPDNQNGSAGLALLSELTGGSGSLGMIGSELLGIKSSGDLFVGVLRSRTVRDRLIDRLQLQTVYRSKLREEARTRLADNTSVSVDRKSGIITLTATDRSPQRAAALSGAYVEELDRLVAQVSTSSARREREFLESRLQAVQKDLEQAEKEFSQFSSKNATVDIKEQGKAMLESAAMVEGQLIATESELEGLKQIYTGNNVRIRSLTARTDELRRQLHKLGGESGNNGDEASGADYPSLRQLPLLGVTYADLFRRARIQEAVFEYLTKQYEMAKVQEAKETPSVKVLDAPTVPEKKSFPPRLLLMILGTLVSGALGMTWVVAGSRWRESDPQDSMKVLAQEVFDTVRAHLPWGSSNGSRLLSGSGHDGEEP